MYQPPALREHDGTRPVSRLSQTSSASTAGGGRSTPSTQHSKVDIVDPAITLQDLLLLLQVHLACTYSYILLYTPLSRCKTCCCYFRCASLPHTPIYPAITLQDLLLLLQVRLACTYSYIPRHHAARPAAATPGAPVYICLHTAVYVSSCYYLCVLIPLYMYVYYICMSTTYYYMCPHICLLYICRLHCVYYISADCWFHSTLLHICLLYISSTLLHICLVHIHATLLHICLVHICRARGWLHSTLRACRHISMYMSSYYASAYFYIYVLVLLYICRARS
jgi:hypothetical protein